MIKLPHLLVNLYVSQMRSNGDEAIITSQGRDDKRAVFLLHRHVAGITGLSRYPPPVSDDPANFMQKGSGPGLRSDPLSAILDWSMAVPTCWPLPLPWLWCDFMQQKIFFCLVLLWYCLQILLWLCFWQNKHSHTYTKKWMWIVICAEGGSGSGPRLSMNGICWGLPLFASNRSVGSAEAGFGPGLWHRFLLL